MKRVRNVLLAAVAAAAMLGSSYAQGAGHSGKTVDWAAYNGSPGGDHFSPLKQVTPANVSSLKLAWKFDTEPGAVESQPLVIGGVMYVASPQQKVAALDAATGAVKWRFDPGERGTQASRGLTWWSNGKQSRLFSSINTFLYALDPATGKPDPAFGENGRIDLRANLRGNAEDNAVFLTSPGTIYKNLIILGSRVAETQPASPGDLRAFDVKTGKLVWVFHTIPHKGEFGAQTWPANASDTLGGANAWPGTTVDVKRGIVYAALGSGADDFYGANRKGNNLFANSIVALDAKTGKRLWHFQAVHHDIWDSDFTGPPVLLTVTRNGKKIDAVAVSDKPSYIYIFDRVTGKPLFPIHEEPVPASDAPGEQASPTQPIPELPAPLVKQTLTRDAVTTRTPEAHAWAQAAVDSYYGTGHFTPLRVGKDTIVSPGAAGGPEWGGMTADPAKGILYVNVNNIVTIAQLVDVNSIKTGGQGEAVFQRQCAGCHGVDRKGSEEFPSLVDVGTRLTKEQIATTIRTGRGRMPAFSTLPPPTVTNVVSYLTSGKDAVDAPIPLGSETGRTPYVFKGFQWFDDPQGYPAGPMPWGSFIAVDMNSGKFLWNVPFGTYPELVAKGMTDTGSESHGGSVLTASGLLFIAASEHDAKFRAFDAANGKILWETQLPGNGMATPATYMVGGKQYVVIAASSPRRRPVPGEAPGAGQAASYMVYALPD